MLDPRQVKTIQDARRIVEERQLTHVKVGIFNIDGIMLCKYISRKKFFSALENHLAFCEVILVSDPKDGIYDNAEYTGKDTGYPDAYVTIIPSSCRDIPFEENQLLFMAEFTKGTEDLCSRAVLRRVLDKAAAMGYEAFAALEYEFFVFDETPDSIRAKGYRDLKPMTPDYYAYSMIRTTVHADFYHQIMKMSEDMDFPIECLHAEAGPGFLEAAIAYDKAVNAGDKAALFKTFMKILAQRNNKMATFMAKLSFNLSGQGGHMHLSLRHSGGGKSAFYDPGQTYNMSRIQRHFLAGQQLLMPELLAMCCPTVNSFSRLTSEFFVPKDATWGVENRTTALRLIPGNDKSQRIEYRLSSADANPYLALAAAIGSGLYGIENQLEPEPEIKGNAYTQTYSPKLILPRTLWDAAQNLRHSTAANALFGPPFVNYFVASREWEELQFRKHVTDWEMDRYFEII